METIIAFLTEVLHGAGPEWVLIIFLLVRDEIRQRQWHQSLTRHLIAEAGLKTKLITAITSLRGTVGNLKDLVLRTAR